MQVEIEKIKKDILSLKGKLSANGANRMEKLETKYSDGKEFQSNCLTIIQSAQENEFTQEGIKVIDKMVKEFKAYSNIQFPELPMLESVALIPQWVASIHSILEQIKEESKSEKSSTKKEARKKVKSLKA